MFEVSSSSGLILTAKWLYVLGGATFTEFHVLTTQLFFCVLCGSENKQRLFPYTALTDRFV